MNTQERIKNQIRLLNDRVADSSKQLIKYTKQVTDDIARIQARDEESRKINSGDNDFRDFMVASALFESVDSNFRWMKQVKERLDRDVTELRTLTCYVEGGSSAS